jgi:hypothetical protein
MTDYATEQERQRRIADLWPRRPDAGFDDVAAEVDEVMAYEAAERAGAKARADAEADGFRSMVTCACGGSAFGSRDGWCERCRAVAVAVTAERYGVEMVAGDRSRREVVEEVLAAQAAAPAWPPLIRGA